MSSSYMMRSEIILISYVDMLKCTSFFVLKTIRDELKEAYSSFIEISIIENMSDDELMVLCLQRTERNILKYLATREFNYEKAFNDIMGSYENSYKDSLRLKLCDYVDYLRVQKFTEKIIIHVDEFSERVLKDISDTFMASDKIIMVAGALEDVLVEYPNCTAFFLNNHEAIDTICKTKCMEFSEILIPCYGFNIMLDDNKCPVLRTNIDEYLDNNNFKLGIFNPLVNK